MGQIRIVLRKDLDPSSYGSVTVEEIRGQTQDGNDLLLVAKKFLADPQPFKIVTILPASQCALIRRSFVQPSGVWKRRVISESVKKKITSRVPACVQQMVLSQEAAAYLVSWAEGTLQKTPRPQRYSFLTHRLFPADDPGPSAPWGPRGRERHVDLGFEDEDADSGSDDAYRPSQDDDDGR